MRSNRLVRTPYYSHSKLHVKPDSGSCHDAWYTISKHGRPARTNRFVQVRTSFSNLRFQRVASLRPFRLWLRSMPVPNLYAGPRRRDTANSLRCSPSLRQFARLLEDRILRQFLPLHEPARPCLPAELRHLRRTPYPPKSLGIAKPWELD